MYGWLDMFVRGGLAAGQFIFGATAIYALLQLLPKRPARWRHMAFLSWRTKSVSDEWLRKLRISRQQPFFLERELLLAGCGITMDAAWYMLARRAAIIAALGVVSLVLMLYSRMLMSISVQVVLAASVLLAALLFMDRTWLRSIRKVRSLQITKEIYAVSNQLLYLSDSALHIHAKLMRCVPFTSAMRADLERLLADWYHDPAIALQQFKQRIGTDDGLSFVETLDALRLHESRQYYELLRVRIADYKEKLELAKESRKESTSYILFVIAGIPILYTFQVFIYPWVREGQKLFQSLG